MSKMFPIQTNRRNTRPHPLSIPWSVAEKAYSTYVAKYGRYQTLERLAERGGFCPLEMDDFYPEWRTEVDEIARLTRELAECKAAAPKSNAYGVYNNTRQRFVQFFPNGPRFTTDRALLDFCLSHIKQQWPDDEFEICQQPAGGGA